jgi:hypothetical protein
MDQDRVIEQDTVRLYRARVTLLESNEDILLGEAKIEYLNPLPVLDDTGRAIGGASISSDGDRVVADLVFDYASPERLDIESDIPVYAHPRGSLRLDALPLSDFDGTLVGPLKVLMVKVTAVALSNKAPREFGARVTTQP